jgi:CO dehydrogenase maturation factor
VRQILGGMMEANHPITIVDMEAGLEHLSRGTARHVDTLLVVLEPYYKALEIGRRAAELGRELGIANVMGIANKLRDEEDVTAVTGFAALHRIRLAAQVPHDDAIRRGDLAGQAPIELTASPAIAAIAKLADQLLRDA